MSRQLVKQTVLVSLGLFVSSSSFAHMLVAQGHGFYSGLLHPLTGVDHLLALFAMGLLASRYSRSTASGILTMTLLMMATGAVLGLSTTALPVVEIGIAGSLLLLGGVLVVGQQLSATMAMLMVSLVAMLHGYAHGQEMTAAFSTASFFAGFLLSSAAILMASMLSSQLQRQYLPHLYRVSGSITAVVGLGLLCNQY